MTRPVVLDIDGAVGSLPGELRLQLAAEQEALRFGCRAAVLRDFGTRLQQALPAPGLHGPVFMGSGDFHHLSLPLVARQAAAQQAGGGPPLRVLVLDNHPDNMRYAFGVHCGSWVRRVAELPGVRGVDVVGITSGDIGAAHAWEQQLRPLRRGTLRYWSCGVDTRWAHWLGLGQAFRSFGSLDALVATLAETLVADPQPTYLSIDKDVFAPEVLHTNWDQGRMTEAHLQPLLQALHGQVRAADVTGEISAYVYKSPLKRWLSRLDAQDTLIALDQLRSWQAGQNAFNRRLLPRLQAAWARPEPALAPVLAAAALR
jgi:hypothetical protein